MQIGTNDYNYRSMIGQVSQVRMTPLSQASYVTSSGTSSVNGTDSMEISQQGHRMSHMMMRARGLEHEAMKEKMTEVQDAVESLNLDELDLSSMSREELEETMANIHSTMDQFRPEGVPEIKHNISERSDDELVSMIQGFSEHADRMLERMDMISGMAEGQMPSMGPPGGGKSQGGMGPMGGMGKMSGMNPMKAYGTETDETSETEELDLIDQLLEALEADEDEETDSENAFVSAIMSYLEVNTDLTFL